MMEEKKWPRNWYRFRLKTEAIEEFEFIGESNTRLFFRKPFRKGKSSISFKKKELCTFPWRETREEAEEDERKYLEEIEGEGKAEVCRNAAPEMLEALNLAEQFIANGVESGYIVMPEENDPALETLSKIRSAIKKARGME